MMGIWGLRVSSIRLSSEVGARFQESKSAPSSQGICNLPDGSKKMRAVYNGVDGDDTRPAKTGEGWWAGSKTSDTV